MCERNGNSYLSINLFLIPSISIGLSGYSYYIIYCIRYIGLPGCILYLYYIPYICWTPRVYIISILYPLYIGFPRISAKKIAWRNQQGQIPTQHQNVSRLIYIKRLPWGEVSVKNTIRFHHPSSAQPLSGARFAFSGCLCKYEGKPEVGNMGHHP